MPADDDRRVRRPIGGGLVEASRPIVRAVDRDVRRADTHPGRVSLPVDFEEDLTGNYKGDELKELRSKRPTDKRLEKLEGFKDEVIERLGKVEVAVADLGGQMKIVPELIGAMKDATAAMQQREQVTFTAQLDVSKAQALGEIETKTIRANGDVVAQKMKWQAVLKLIAIVSVVATALAGAFAAGRC